METLIAWLEKNEPPDDGRASLVHGDYRIDNMIFKPDGSRLLAVIDWELSTIGHPFSDLAYQCMQWRFPNHETMRGLADVDRKALGIPTEEEYIAKYCERMGIAGIPNWKFCLAFSFFRLAAIVQGVKKRGLEGNASNPEKALKSGERVPHDGQDGRRRDLNARHGSIPAPPFARWMQGFLVHGCARAQLHYGSVRAHASRGRRWTLSSRGGLHRAPVSAGALGPAACSITLLCVCSPTSVGRLTSRPHLQQHPPVHRWSIPS